MVPGSTLMYGSSLRMLTRRPRALRMRPMLAAVMPLPRLLATPPVTKTYFDMGRGSSGVFLMLSESAGGRESRRPEIRRGGSAGGGPKEPGGRIAERGHDISRGHDGRRGRPISADD